MTEIKQEESVLAPFTLLRPDDVVREEKERLEGIIAKDAPQWWRDYSDVFYDDLRKPSAFPTIFLGIVNVLALGWIAVAAFGPWSLPSFHIIMGLVVIGYISAGVGFSDPESANRMHGWAGLRNLFFPLGFFVTLVEWRARKSLRECTFSYSAASVARDALRRLFPAVVVRERYVSDVRKFRQDFLGSESTMVTAEARLVTQVREAKKVLTELEQRLPATGSAPEREKLLEQGVARARERVAKLEALLERHNLAIKKATEFLDRCHALAVGMDGAVGDLELLRKLDASIEEDCSVIRQAEEVVGEKVEELYLRMKGLQEAVSDVSLPTNWSEEVAAVTSPIEEEFSEYERLSERVLALDVTSLMPQKPAAP